MGVGRSGPWRAPCRACRSRRARLRAVRCAGAHPPKDQGAAHPRGLPGRRFQREHQLDLPGRVLVFSAGDTAPLEEIERNAFESVH